MPLKQKSKHIVTSARGKKIDFEALKRQNETVRAVGNVPVNANAEISLASAPEVTRYSKTTTSPSVTDLPEVPSPNLTS